MTTAYEGGPGAIE